MNSLIKLASFSILYCYAMVVLAQTNNYEEALQAYNENNIEAAYIHLKNVLKEDENNLPAKLLMANVLIEKKMYAAAEETLNDAAYQGADFNLIIEPLGQSLLLQGKYNEAIHVADQKKLYKSGLLAYKIIKAKANVGLLNDEAANTLYQEVLESDPKNINAIIGLAEINIRKDALTKSADLLVQAESIEPKNAQLWQVKGQLAQKQKQLDNALSFYKKADEFSPDNLSILRSIASIQIELKQLNEALSTIDQALSIQPKDIQAQLSKGKILKLLGKKSASFEVLAKLSNQLSAIDESIMLSQPSLLLIDAMSRYGQEQWLQAQKKLQQYVKQTNADKDMNAVVLLADVYVRLNKSDKALELLSRYESELLKNKDYALVLVDLYLQFKENFKADYVLTQLKHTYKHDEEITILSAKVLANTDQKAKALALLESTKGFSSANYQYSLAVTAFQVGEFPKALKYTESLIERSPDNVEYQLLYVRILLQLKQYDTAKNTIVKLNKEHPENKEVRYNYAILQFNLNKPQVAKNLLKKIVQDYPNDADSWFMLAQIEYELQNTEDAIAILEKQARNTDIRTKALYKLSKVYFAEKKYQKSIETTDRLLKDDRLNTLFLFLKAENLIALKQNKQAKHQLDILSGLLNDQPRSLLKLSQLQQKIGDYIAAEKSLSQGITIAPNALPILIDLVKVNIKLNKLTQAERYIKHAEQQGYKKNLYVLLLKGDIEVAKGNITKASSYYYKVLNNDNNNIVALMALSQVSTSRTLSTKFIQELNLIVKKHPDYVLHRHILADDLFAQNKYQQAKLQYQQLLTQNIPTEKAALALNNLAIIYIEEKNFQFAVDTSKQANEMLSSPLIKDTFGWALVLSGETEKGLSLLRQAYSMFSASIAIQYHLGYALVQLKRVSEAKTFLKRIIEHPDTSPEYIKAKKLLASL